MTASPLLRAVLQRTALAANLLMLVGILTVVYTTQIVETNSYMGYQPLAFTSLGVGIGVVSVVILSLSISTSVTRPSDFFLLTYGLFVILPYVALHAIKGAIGVSDYTLHLALLLFPVAALRMTCVFPIAIRLPATLHPRLVEWLAIAVSVGGVVAALLNRPATSSMDITTVYDRRLEAREIFRTGSLLAYTASAVANGLIPFIAFIGGLRSSRRLLLLAIALALALFYVLGLKAPFLYALLAFGLGLAFRTGKSRLVLRGVFASLIFLFLLFLLERALWPVSLIGEYFFRRAFVVPADLLTSYLDLMFGSSSHWSLLNGIETPDGITFLVGERYGLGEEANANTNAFFNALGSRGLPGYFAIVALTTSVFAACDMAFRATGNHAYYFLGFEYALLVSEQSATTALVSSGIGFLGLLVGFSGAGWTPERVGKPEDHVFVIPGAVAPRDARFNGAQR